jgi:hypothetical protein
MVRLLCIMLLVQDTHMMDIFLLWTLGVLGEGAISFGLCLFKFHRKVQRERLNDRLVHDRFKVWGLLHLLLHYRRSLMELALRYRDGLWCNIFSWVASWQIQIDRRPLFNGI